MDVKALTSGDRSEEMHITEKHVQKQLRAT